MYLKKTVADWKLVAGAGLPCFRSSATLIGSMPVISRTLSPTSYVCIASMLPWFIPHAIPIEPKILCGTVDREIFTVKIIRVLNFRFKNISPPDGSAM